MNGVLMIVLPVVLLKCDGGRRFPQQPEQNRYHTHRRYAWKLAEEGYTDKVFLQDKAGFSTHTLLLTLQISQDGTIVQKRYLQY